MLAGAGLCAVAFGVLLLLAYWVEPTRWLDFAALDGFVALNRPPLSSGADALAHVFNPGPFTGMVIVLLAIGVRTRGLRHAAAAGLLLVGANLSSQALKPLLAHPRSLSEWDSLEQISSAAFPSGHATASMSLAFAAVLVAPRAYRPLVATVGGAVALAVAMALMILNWHYPSDVVGGQLLATAWALVALAALRAAGARWPERGSMRRAARDAVTVPSLAGPALLGVLVVGAALALTRASDLVLYAQRHTAALAVGAAVIFSAVLLLAAVTALATRRA